MISSRQDKWIEHSRVTWSRFHKPTLCAGRSRIRKVPAIKFAHNCRLYEKGRRQKCHQTVSGLWSI